MGRNRTTEALHGVREQIAADYAAGLTQVALAAKYGGSRNFHARLLSGMGVPLRQHRGRPTDAELERREAMAQRVAAGEKPLAVAEDLGVYISTVYRACAACGVRPKMLKLNMARASENRERIRDLAARSVGAEQIAAQLCVSASTIRRALLAD